MTQLATDPLTLVHLAISLAAIATGLPVLAAMLKGRTPVTLTGIFLGLTVLTSVTGAKSLRMSSVLDCSAVLMV